MIIQLLLDGQMAAEVDLNGGDRVIGSSEPSKILIEDPSVSPAHAKVYQEKGNLFIADLGSERGTMVDGRKIGEPTALQDGQSIQIGGFELQIKVLPEESMVADAPPSSPKTLPAEEALGNNRASAMSSAKSAAAGIGKGLLGMAGASAKEAGRGARLTSLKAQIEKLRRTDLRRAYGALGAKARASGLAQQACPELMAEIQALDDELAEKRKGSDAGGDAGLMAKAKAKALGAKMWAEAEMLERKIHGILAAIGENLAGNPPEDAALSAELREIADISLKIQALQDQFDAAYSDGSARAAFAESAGSVHREASVAASAIPSGDVGPRDGKRSKLALAGLAMGLLSIPLLFVKPLALLLAAGALIAGCLGWFMARKSGGSRYGGKLNVAAMSIGVIVIAYASVAGTGSTKIPPHVAGLWIADEAAALFHLKDNGSMTIITPFGMREKQFNKVKQNVYEFQRWDDNGMLTFHALDERTARLEEPNGNIVVLYKGIQGTPEEMIAMVMAAWNIDRQNSQAAAVRYNDESSRGFGQANSAGLPPGEGKDWATLDRERKAEVAKLQQQRENAEADQRAYAERRRLESDQKEAETAAFRAKIARDSARHQNIEVVKTEIRAIESELRALKASRADSQVIIAKENLLRAKQEQMSSLMRQ